MIVSICSLALTVLLCLTSPVAHYIASIRNQTAVPVFLTDNVALRAKINHEAEKQEIAPINARNDRVWKLVPGLDGRVVDKEATYAKTKQKGTKQIQWVYRSVQPKVSLKDLGAGPIYRGNEHQQAVALMVNVAWGTEHLAKMLEIFQKEGVRATFFVDGTWLHSHQTEALQLAKAGHEIGNHGYTHRMMSQVPVDRMQREISRTEELIKKVYGHPSKWFAPPGGDFNQKVVEVAASYQLGTVLWTVDTIDWRKTTSPTAMVNKISRDVSPGNLILMHPTDRTVEALPGIIRAIKQKKLALRSVSEVLASKRITH
jgi:probable sporulation protein (polysaccharide deacetylase family)